MDFNVSYLYYTLLACSATLMLFFSYVLLCSALSTKQGDQQYIHSRKLLGYTFLTFAILFLVHWIAMPLDLPVSVFGAWTMMCVHFGTVLIIMGFTNLADHDYITHRQMNRDFGVWFVNTLLYWAAALLVPQGAVQTAFICLSIVIYLIDFFYMIRRFRNSCKKTSREMDNFYSEDVDPFTKYLTRSVYILAVLGAMSTVLFVTSLSLKCPFLIIYIGIFSHIFITFLNHIVEFRSISDAIQRVDELEKEPKEKTLQTKESQEVEPYSAKPASSSAEVASATTAQGDTLVHTDTVDSPETFAPAVPLKHEGTNNVSRSPEMEDKASLTERLLRENLDKWIVNGGYLDQGMTLEELASSLMTNRTYLSGYINQTYNCTFKEFIYMLRIEAAIQIMMEEPQISVEDLGTRVGIPSASTFNRQFVKQMGVTPAIWKMSNLQKKV